MMVSAALSLNMINFRYFLFIYLIANDKSHLEWVRVSYGTSTLNSKVLVCVYMAISMHILVIIIAFAGFIIL